MKHLNRSVQWLRLGLAAALCALAVAGQAEAVTVTWNLTGSDSTTGSPGNELSFTAAGGEVLWTRAFATTNGTGNFGAAYLGRYSGGLGVTSSSDGTGASPTNTVDNIGTRDLVVFKFSAAYIPTSVFLSQFGDTDFTAYVGGNPGLTFFSFAGLSYSTLGANGFTQYTCGNADLLWQSCTHDIVSNPQNRLAGLNNLGLNLSGQWLIIGTRDEPTVEDQFLIKTLNGTAVPEPGTLLLLGVGLLATGLWSRKRFF